MAYALGFGGATQLVGPAIGGYLYMAIPAFPRSQVVLLAQVLP